LIYRGWLFNKHNFSFSVIPAYWGNVTVSFSKGWLGELKLERKEMVV
jgi:hypothetical protein